jgi:RNA polymerase sigma-70 factor (ECF subfamily)
MTNALALDCPSQLDAAPTSERAPTGALADPAWRDRVDSALLDACAEGSPTAWRRLHRVCYPLAATFLRKLGVLELDLDDALQEVFVQLFRYLPGFRREAELSTWLYRICITQARSVHRRRRLSQALSRLLSCSPPATLVSSPSLPDDVVRRRVEAALAQLSERDRTVFVLYEMEGVPGKRIAEIVNSPEASVWRRLHEARRHFRRALETDPELG